MSDKITLDEIDDFTRAYIEAALWSSTDESREDGGDPLDKNYSPEDLTDEALARIVCDCSEFQIRHTELLHDAKYNKSEWSDSEMAGHDFWLTRNGHGCGFWDRGLGEVGDKLTEAAHAAGECNLYVGDDEKVHVL